MNRESIGKISLTKLNKTSAIQSASSDFIAEDLHLVGLGSKFASSKWKLQLKRYLAYIVDQYIMGMSPQSV